MQKRIILRHSQDETLDVEIFYREEDQPDKEALFLQAKSENKIPPGQGPDQYWLEEDQRANLFFFAMRKQC